MPSRVKAFEWIVALLGGVEFSLEASFLAWFCTAVVHGVLVMAER
jgi:hypothetical protein